MANNLYNNNSELCDNETPVNISYNFTILLALCTVQWYFFTNMPHQIIAISTIGHCAKNYAFQPIIWGKIQF
jgi:hypothetical protein